MGLRACLSEVITDPVSPDLVALVAQLRFNASGVPYGMASTKHPDVDLTVGQKIVVFFEAADETPLLDNSEFGDASSVYVFPSVDWDTNIVYGAILSPVPKAALKAAYESFGFTNWASLTSYRQLMDAMIQHTNPALSVANIEAQLQ